MTRPSFTIRFFVPVMVFSCFLFFSIAVMSYVYSQLSSSLYSKARQRIEITSEMLAYMLESLRSDISSEHSQRVVQRIIENVAAGENVDAIYLIGQDLTIMRDGNRKLTGSAAPSEISQFASEAFQKGMPLSKVVAVGDESILITTTPIRGGIFDATKRSSYLGALSVSSNFRDEEAYLSKFLNTIFIVLFLCGLGVSWALQVILSRRIVRPLQRLNVSVKIVASGELSHRASGFRNDEIGSVVEAFNLMLDKQVEGNELQRRLAKARDEAEQKASELVRTNDALVKAQATLVNSAKMASLGEMAGGIAHEINNPLAVITMRSQQIKRILTQETPKVDQALEFLGIVESTAYRISQIITGMQSFSRNADKDPFQKISVATIIHDALSLCTEKIRNNGVDLQVDSQDLFVEIQCRPAQICQVLLNLILNANDAISQLDEKWIKISVTKTDQAAHIAITDSGSGIPEVVYEKMFQPFFTTKEIGKGTGLGLSISKGIIEEHGGKLRLDRDSQHTCFVISFPISKIDAAKISA